MREMMEAKLMALKKLKSKMKDMMRMEKDEPHHEQLVEATPKTTMWEIDDDDQDMHNREDKREEEMIPRRSGRTKNVMMSMGTVRKFGKK